MSEEKPQITSVERPTKPKDPKRVEAGRRLGELSRQARERKKLEREQEANNNNNNDEHLNTLRHS